MSRTFHATAIGRMGLAARLAAPGKSGPDAASRLDSKFALPYIDNPQPN
jgi:hypothetical protein